MGHIEEMDMVCASLAFIDGLGGPEMLLIFVIVLVLFGGQKLPEFARGLGKTMREFKKAASGVEEEFKRALEEDERKNNAAKLAAAPTQPAPVTDEYMDPAYDSGGPESGAHPPEPDDHGTAETGSPSDDVPSDVQSPAAEDMPENQDGDSATTEKEPKILPPAPSSPTPAAVPPKPSVPPAASAPENPS
jgi:sec-independent protein translocase protein TatA